VSSTLQHPASLVARVSLLGTVVQAGLHECAADLLSVAALDLLAEQARTQGRPELALHRAMESASVRSVLAAVAGPEAVESCLAALRLRDLDLLAARLCLPAPGASTEPVPGDALRPAAVTG
jgi:hypothetical protein